MSAFGHWDTVAPLQIWDGVVGRAVTGAEATLAAIELEPGTKVPEHQHVNEQTGMLIRGSLTFRIGDETQELRPGSTWVIPADVRHSVDAGPEGASIQVRWRQQVRARGSRVRRHGVRAGGPPRATRTVSTLDRAGR